MLFDLFRRQPAVRMAGCVVTDVGRVRRNNEDNFLLDHRLNETTENHLSYHCRQTRPGWQIAAVFDGMGGGERGEIAALESARMFEKAAALPAYASPEAAEKAVRNAFQAANNRVVLLQRRRISGTTGTVVLTDGRRFQVFHMGDSRAYFFRGGQLLQLTRDHTLAQFKKDAGMDLVPEQDRHMLMNFIGRDSTMSGAIPDSTGWMALRRGDQLLLCSDGLFDMCSDAQIAAVLRTHKKITDKTAELTRLALEVGGGDNVTCVLLRFF